MRRNHEKEWKVFTGRTDRCPQDTHTATLLLREPSQPRATLGIVPSGALVASYPCAFTVGTRARDTVFARRYAWRERCTPLGETSFAS